MGTTGANLKLAIVGMNLESFVALSFPTEARKLGRCRSHAHARVILREEPLQSFHYRPASRPLFSLLRTPIDRDRQHNKEEDKGKGECHMAPSSGALEGCSES